MVNQTLGPGSWWNFFFQETPIKPYRRTCFFIFTDEEMELKVFVASKRQNEILNPSLIPKPVYFTCNNSHPTDTVLNIFTAEGGGFYVMADPCLQ